MSLAHTEKCNAFRQHGSGCICSDPEDEVNHPTHYTSHPTGVECIDIAEHMSFNVGNAVKYLWRAGLKTSDSKRDLQKARWYVDRELKRLYGQKD